MSLENFRKNGDRVAVSEYTNVYDELNRLIQKGDPYNVIESLKYNDASLQTESYDVYNNVTVFEYDKNNRLVKTIKKSKTGEHISTTSKTYDLAGNVSSSTDGENNTTRYEYDEFDRLTKVINAQNEETSYTYDLNGNMLTQTDGRGYTTTYEYNVANLLVRRSDPGGRTGEEGNYTYLSEKTVFYRYYPDGNLKEMVDRKGVTTEYVYDVHGRLIGETAGNINISYTYDKSGNQLTVNDTTGTTRRYYDRLGRVTSKTVPNIGTITFSYDIIYDEEKGYVAEVATDPKGNTTTKVYDKAGRLKFVIDGDDITEYTYYPDGRRASVVYPDGSRQEYKYYDSGLLYILKNWKSDGTAMDSYTYEYDAAGNQVGKFEIINGLIKGKTTYTYDKLNRLKTVTEPNGKVTEYTYDASGNRETETIRYNSETIVNTYENNEQNRLLRVVTRVNGSVTETTVYTYDNNGNQLAATTNGSNVQSNTYDEKNQLIKTVAGGKTIINIYNGEGLRVAKSVNGSLTRYLYEYDKVILEVNGSGNQIARNLYGINLLMRTVDGESYYYMYNGHADVTALVNAATGEVAATYYYDAFGNILESTGDVNNNITYAGYQYDEETGLYYLNARMYDPKIARFLQEDTYRGDPMDPLSLNLYAYCAYNPIMYYDPTGHNYIEIFGIPFGNPIEGIKTVFNKEKRKEAFEVIDLYMREDDQESNTKRIVRASVGTYKALKAIGEGGKDIAKSIFTPAATWIAFAGGEIYNWVTEKDEAFRQDFRELMWEEIYRIGDQDSLFKPLGNWIGYGGTIIYANITGQDREFKQILHEEALNEISRSGFAAIEAIQSPFKNTFNRQNASRYFQKAYYTPQEKLNEYATNMLVVGMIATGICSKANASGLKINVNFQNIAYGNGNLALATLPRISVSVSQSLPAASVGTMGNIMVVVANSGGFGGNSEIELPENTINAGKPGSPQWKDAVKTLRESKGKGINIKVENQADAHRLMKEAGLDLELKPTYTNEPYKAGYEVHPAEPNVGNNFPHIKWKDWTGGKSNGAEGHIFFER